jgi:putative ABC transport system permease protein
MDAEQYILGMFDNNNFTLRYWPQWSHDNQPISTWAWHGGERFDASLVEGYEQWDVYRGDVEDKDAFSEWFNTFDHEAYSAWHQEAYQNFLAQGQQEPNYEGFDFPIIFGTPSHKFDSDYLHRLENLPGFISAVSLTRAAALMVYSSGFEAYARERVTSVRYVNFPGDLEAHIEMQLTEPHINRNFTSNIYGVDVEQVRTVKDTFYPPIDIEAFERGEIALLSDPRIPELLEGINNIEVVLSGGRVSFEVAGVVSRMFGDIRSFGNAPAVIVAKPFLEQYANTYIYQINLRIDDRYEQQALLELEAMTEHDAEVLLTSRITERAGVRSIQMFFWIIGGSVAGVIGLTGLLNFINVMSVGVMSRRKELAAMESIGMTRKQVRRMLVYEGLGYAAAALVSAGVIGNLIAVSLYNLIADFDNTNIFNFNYPYIPFTITVLVILSVCTVTPLMAYSEINRLTIVERLREID